MSPSRSMFALATTGATLVGGTMVGQAAVNAAPPQPKDIGRNIESFAPMVPANSCANIDHKGLTGVGELLRAAYPGTGYTTFRSCGTNQIVQSNHYDNRGIDWQVNVRVPGQKRMADDFLHWLLKADKHGNKAANAKRLGIQTIIWDNKVWRSWNGGYWNEYRGCNSMPGVARDSFCHRNHVHMSLSWAGAQAKTSYWTNKKAPHDYGPCRIQGLNWAPRYTKFRAKPCPSVPKIYPKAGSSADHVRLVKYSGMEVATGQRGDLVKAVQRAVGLSGSRVDGFFGDDTRGAVKYFQKTFGLKETGVMDVPTWRKVLEVTGPGYSGKKVNNPPRGYDEIKPRPGEGKGKYGQWEHVRVAYGDGGRVVRVLQGALGVSVDGNFGPKTRNAVLELQRKKGLQPTGVVNKWTWRALGGALKGGDNDTKPEKHKYEHLKNIKLTYGKKGEHVRTLQRALGFKGDEVTGWFGKDTKTALLNFQKANKLRENGFTSPAVWKKLADDNSTFPPIGDNDGKNKYEEYFDTTLKHGDVGTKVSVLQEALGYPKGETTGYFGGRTERTLADFQKANGLEVTRVSDRATWKKLGEDHKKVDVSKSGHKFAAYEDTLLKPGSTGDEVRLLQKTLGFTGKGVDGYFGPGTRTALKNFQKANGLKETGHTTKQTWITLSSSKAKFPEISDRHTYFNFEHVVLKKGDKSKSVTTLHKALGFAWSDHGVTFGERTEKALKAFQEANGLKVTGKTNPATWQKLGDKDSVFPDIPRAVPPGEKDDAPKDDAPKDDAPKDETPKDDGKKDDGKAEHPYADYESMTLRKGLVSKDVATLQKALGYPEGENTGFFGGRTERALKAFQEANGLKVTGETNPATWRKLGDSSSTFPKVPALPRKGAQGSPHTAKPKGAPVAPTEGKSGDTTAPKTGGETDGKTGDSGKTGSSDKAENGKKGSETAAPAPAPAPEPAPKKKAPTVAEDRNPFEEFQATTLKNGSSGSKVNVLQAALGFSGASVDGGFGKGTERALKAFQKANGLQQTGTTTKETWLALGDPASVLPSPEAPAPVPATGGGNRLAFGDSGEKVLELQQKLGVKDQSGTFDQATKEAVLEHQRAEGMTANGVVDSKFWDSL